MFVIVAIEVTPGRVSQVSPVSFDLKIICWFPDLISGDARIVESGLAGVDDNLFHEFRGLLVSIQSQPMSCEPETLTIRMAAASRMVVLVMVV